MTAAQPRRKAYRLDLPGVRRRLTPEFSGRPRRRPERTERRDRFDGTPPLRFA